MTDLRAQIHVARTRALRVRANVRALAAKLAAAEYALARDARRSDDPQMGVFAAQLTAERQSIAALGVQLDERIALIDRACRALDASIVAATRVSAGSACRAARATANVRR